MAMFEKAEDEYNDLISKKNIIKVCVIGLFSIYWCHNILTWISFVVEWQVKDQDGDWGTWWEEERNTQSHLGKS